MVFAGSIIWWFSEVWKCYVSGMSSWILSLYGWRTESKNVSLYGTIVCPKLELSVKLFDNFLLELFLWSFVCNILLVFCFVCNFAEEEALCFMFKYTINVVYKSYLVEKKCLFLLSNILCICLVVLFIPFILDYFEKCASVFEVMEKIWWFTFLRHILWAKIWD